MNILKEYTLDYIKRNKKSSIAIMIAILIATILLSALSGALYTFYTDEVRLIILEKGNWHAELFDNTPSDKLKYVTAHPNVEKVMIKGPWKIAEIDDSRRPYIAMRGLSQSYWEDMPENTAILEGKIPNSENEIALSKQYFENHPDLKVGDSLTLDLGSRRLNGKEMDFNAPFKDEEFFLPTVKRTYIVVAKLDITTNSMTPYYMAYGYLNEANILPDDQLTVYMRFKNPRSTYEDIDNIAKSVGFKPDEYGKYTVRTNDSLLAKYLIFPPEERGNFKLWMLSQPVTISVIALLVAGVFVFIINNAFAMSANVRLRQLGMLKSIGASPKQIQHSVIFEGFILSVIPIPVGLFIGWALDYGLFSYINSVKNLRDYNLVFTFGFPAALPSVALALLTVWLSALIPARKISRLMPIDAIRQGENIKIKKVKKHNIASKIFGIEGELAQNALYIRKKSYRTASISLTLSFLLFSGFLNFMAVNDAKNKIFYFDKLKEQQLDISLYIEDGNMTEPEFENQIRSVHGLKRALFASNVPAGLWLSTDMESDELRGIGGLKRIADSRKFSVYEENGKFRIQTNLIALDDQSFAEYCKQIGADSSMFYDTERPLTIVVNEVQDDMHSDIRNEVRIPFLKINVGDRLNEEEKTYLEDTSDFSFQTEIGFLTDKMPAVGDRYGGYQLIQVMPRSTYLKIIENFQEVRVLRGKRIFVPIVVQSENLIQPVTDEIIEICDKWYGSGDYSIWNILETRETDTNSRNLLKTVMLCVAVFLALIGISNVFATVSGNLRQRKKEFAMLRSVGISSKGIKRMLLLEGILFGIIPIVLSIPLNVIVICVFLKINMIYLKEFLPFLPALPILIFGGVILLSVILAYAMGGRMLRKGDIVDILKDETV
ncbi:MAG: ABC transporter permease [Tissierellaceae bacterium]|nr:ABC transporter permease [Tissierellaceae bacterium]